MFNKKGNITLVTLFEIILGIMVFLLFMNLADTIGNPHQIERFSVAKDVALLLDTVQAIPYDVYYPYPEILYGSELNMVENIVSVGPKKLSTSSVHKDVLVVTKYHYIPTNYFILANTTTDVSFLTIEKKAPVTDNQLGVKKRVKGTITLSNELFPEPILIEIKKQSRDQIVIVVDVEKQDEVANKNILERLQNDLSGKLLREFPNEGDATIRIQLSLNQDVSSDDELGAEAGFISYSSLEESKQLVNKIAKKLAIIKINFLVQPSLSAQEQTSSFIKIELSNKFANTLKNSNSHLRSFTNSVVTTIDSFYE